jgi:hypothetical protein
VRLPLGAVPVVLPGAGGLGASTIPEVGGVVEGVGIESSGTEWAVGRVAAVGDVFEGLPFTLFSGWGMLTGPDVTGVWGRMGWDVSFCTDGGLLVVSLVFSSYAV